MRIRILIYANWAVGGVWYFVGQYEQAIFFVVVAILCRLEANAGGGWGDQ